MKKAIMIEIECAECSGVGTFEYHLCDPDGYSYDRSGVRISGWVCPGEKLCGETRTTTCDACQGTKYQQERISIEEFKKLLKE